MTERGNFVSQCKECVYELNGFIREASRRAYQINSQIHGEISRWLSTLERKTVWEKAQFRVIEYSKKLCQEGIELVQVCARTTWLEVLEPLR
jgi:hypothetical protein